MLSAQLTAAGVAPGSVLAILPGGEHGVTIIRNA
jgi:hypothetical protein